MDGDLDPFMQVRQALRNHPSTAMSCTRAMAVPALLGFSGRLRIS